MDDSHSTAWDEQFSRDIWCLLGMPIDALRMTQVVGRIREAAATDRPLFLSTPNLNFAMAAQSHSLFRESLIESDMCIADGMPLVWVARLLGVPVSERVPGSGVVEALRREPSQSPMPVYFFGGPPGVAEMACQRLSAESGGLLCCGAHFPGMGDVEAMSRPQTLDAINASGPRFVIVALGARKGQAWIMRNREALDAPVISHLGAVVNFVAGRVRRAPLGWQRLGLEWLWRIREEPVLWRRYATDGLGFLRLLMMRVVPYALSLRFCSGRGAGPQVRVERDGEDMRVVLAGRWVGAGHAPLREAFVQVLKSEGDVILDMAAVRCADPALFGGVLSLVKCLDRQGRQLRIAPLSRRVRRLFRWNCLDYLLS